MGFREYTFRTVHASLSFFLVVVQSQPRPTENGINCEAPNEVVSK